MVVSFDEMSELEKIKNFLSMVLCDDGRLQHVSDITGKSLSELEDRLYYKIVIPYTCGKEANYEEFKENYFDYIDEAIEEILAEAIDWER